MSSLLALLLGVALAVLAAVGRTGSTPQSPPPRAFLPALAALVDNGEPPTPTPKPVEQPRAGVFDEGRVIPLPYPVPTPLADAQSVLALLASLGWDVDIELAVRVAHCESRWSPDARNGRALGLFQLMWYEQDGWSGWARWAVEEGVISDEEFDLWYDPAVNAKVALAVVRRSGWSPWECWGLVQ